MSVYQMLILASTLVIASYLFNLAARRTRIPAVLLLIATGVILRRFDVTALPAASVQPLVGFLGTVGLIMIVLEGSLDLKISRESLATVRNAFLSALVLLLASSLGVAFLFRLWLAEPWRICLAYAIPLAVISSAIVLPSVGHLEAGKREFIVCEATFSDILGIVLFNEVVFGDLGSVFAVALAGAELVLMVGLSLVTALGLFLLIGWFGSRERFFLLFAILILLFSLGKLFHLSSLILIMAFGLVTRNFRSISRSLPWGRFDTGTGEATLEELRKMTAETSFLVRTFFFILFGYGIDFSLLGSEVVLQVGGITVALFLLLRWIYLKFLLRIRVFPELFLSPRGLITILLFYSIPDQFKTRHFDEGVVTFVVLATNILMAVALVVCRRSTQEVCLQEGERSP
jgi:NhaP-type Na+/H+ or K+/H+ antiporter